MPKFVLCDHQVTHPGGPTWLNLDFVESITETQEIIHDPLPDAHGETPTHKGDLVLYLVVAGDGRKYVIKNPDWIDAVKSFLVRSLGECSD